MIVKGYARDTMWFAIVQDDWPEVKKEFEKWLNEGNFDGKGQQKTKLNMPNRNSKVL